MSGGFHVMSRRCDQCLLSPERIVSSRRASEILKQCARDDTHFLCHKGTMAGRDIGCRAHFDMAPGKVPRFAQWLGLITEIDPDTLASVDTLPKGQDGEAGLVRSKGGAVGEAETPNLSDLSPNPKGTES